MLHPVGPLPTAVYWRRRLLVLLLVVAVLGGGGWLLVAALGGAPGRTSTATAAATSAAAATEPPALERVLPPVTGVRTPTPAPEPPAEPEPSAEPPAATQAPGGPCGDDAVELVVRSPGSAPAGSKPTFELVVTNVSPVPCVRVLDERLQEVLLLDEAGNRVWGSNDCFPGDGTQTRTLAPGESVTASLVWGGLTSEPSCTAPRTTPAPGEYVLRGRLDTEVSPDVPFTVS
ncbi:MucR family transcriptional regulator [Geodermatophilus sp. DSM 44513]|uniref:MucR family transcriptional regulator n=1 Tax=Geodermatophilus sp. DSM 44513 TaxID=1528104 RepID=UPI0012845CA5|nr:MucR family transcriptional regulator [Geodermatophilus sp. DSM 44513]WNV76260.1 MucR family transcriptional regulator [Geodermatophilus sp. DSM 44513]